MFAAAFFGYGNDARFVPRQCLTAFDVTAAFTDTGFVTV